MNRTLAAIAAVISVATVAAGDEIRTFQSGQNQIEVREYSPRDVSDKDRAIAMLQREWNTDETIQWDTAALLAILCEQVYSDDDETLDYLIRGIGFTEWIAVRNQSMAGHVLRGKDVTVVVFRGTNFTEIPDWLRNLDAWFVRTQIGSYHRGFRDAYVMLRRDVRRYLAERDSKHLWVAGHSLGGAMAVNCALDLELADGGEPTLVTFGQPRVADTTGAKWLDEKLAGRYVRFVHGQDIVASVPFYVPGLFPYAHAGRLVAIQEDGVSVGESIDSTPTLASSYCGTCGRLTSGVNVKVYQPSNEPPPLTESEFRELIANARISAVAGYREGADGTMAEAVVIEAYADYITDHFVAGYVALIRRYRDGNPVMMLGPGG